MPIVCVDVLIVKNERCLLLLRDNEPAKGTYWFPGGRILKNETIPIAALRKAKEETNLLCSFIKILAVEESIFPKQRSMVTDIHTINICCLLEVKDIDTIQTDNLHAGFIWVNELSSTYHQAVNHPLSLLGYT